VGGWDVTGVLNRNWMGGLNLRTGAVVVSCEDGNEPPGSIKCGEFLD